MDKIKFKDLSWPIKVGVVSGWVFGSLYLILFIAGFIIGALA